MTEQRLLLLKEKIIKTDALINLLTEKNFKQKKLQAKLQFLFKKFVEKSKEAETLHRKLCIYIADHEPLKKRITELETQYSEVETNYHKFVNSSELKFQIINKELDVLKRKNGELLKTNKELQSLLSTRTTQTNNENSIQEDEFNFLKTENEILSRHVEKLTARCDKDSEEIGRLALLLTKTNGSSEQVQVDAHLVQTSQLKEEISKLEITEEELRSKVKVLKRERSKLEDQLSELRLEKNSLKKSSVDLEKQLNQKCSQKSKQIETLSFPFIDSDANIIQVKTHLKEKISKLKLTKEQLRHEVTDLKMERDKLGDQLAELRLEKILLNESNIGLAEQFNQDLHERCNTSEGKFIEGMSLPLGTDLSNENQMEPPQDKNKLSKLEFTEEQVRNEVNNLLEESNVGFEDETDGIELFGVEDFEETSDAESVTNLLKEMMDLPAALVPFRDDSCSETEDCLGFAPTQIKNCVVCANVVPATPSKILVGGDRKTNSDVLQCQTTSGDFNVRVVNKECHQSNILVATKNRSGININSKQKQAENTSEEKCKAIAYRMRKRSGKPIVKKKHLKTKESAVLKRLKLAITQDMLKCMNRYFRRNLKSLTKFDDECTCKHKSAQFLRNKKLIRRKVEKLREIDTSESENESSPTKRNNLKRNSNITRKFSPIKSVADKERTADELYTGVSNKATTPNRSQKIQISNDIETHKQQQNHAQSVCAAARLNQEKSDVYSEKTTEFEVISQDSGYARSEADSLELELQNHEKIFVRSADTPESQPKKNTHGHRSSSVKRKCKEDKTVKKLVNSKALECAISINSLRSPNLIESSDKELNSATATCDVYRNNSSASPQSLKHKEVEMSPSCSIDSPDSPEPEENYDSFRSLSPVKERTTIYDQVQINSNSPDNACTKQLQDIRISCGGTLVPEDTLKHPKDHISSTVVKANTTQASFKRPNCAKRSSHQSLKHRGVEISLSCSIDSPDSPEPEGNYDSFRSLSPVKERTTIYNQVQINSSSPDNANVNDIVCAKQPQDVRISCGGMLVPEDHVSCTIVKAKTTEASFKRPNCAKRMKPIPIVVPPEPPVVTMPVPVKKIYQMKNAQARKLFKKLLNFGNESSIVEEIASKFTGQNKERVASLILSEVCLYASEKLETKYTPPAPPLTQVQRLLLGFMYKLETTCMSGLLEIFLSAAEKALLVETNLEHLQQTTRLYVGVCKFKRDLDRMRRTVCDAFYFMEDLAVPFLFTVLSSWIEVLPLQIHSTDDVLVKVLIQVINLKTCKTPGYNLLPLRNLLKAYYEYPTERWNSDDVFREVFAAYLGNPTRSNEYAILILCKNHSPKWVLQQMDMHIKNALVNPDGVDLKTKIMMTVTRMVSQFRSCKEAVDATNLKTWLSTCLQGGLPCELEDSIRKCINLL